MNPVNGPVLVALLLALVVLVLVVDAQRRVIVRTRESLQRSRSRVSVLREKLTIAEQHTCEPSGFIREPTTDGSIGYWSVPDEPIPYLPAESYATSVARHPATRAQDRLTVVRGGA